MALWDIWTLYKTQSSQYYNQSTDISICCSHHNWLRTMNLYIAIFFIDDKTIWKYIYGYTHVLCYCVAEAYLQHLNLFCVEIDGQFYTN